MLHTRFASFTVFIGLIALAGLIVGGISPTFAAKSVDPEHAILLPVVFKKDFDLKVNSVMVIQGTTSSESYQLSLANRETIARVFVGTGSGKTVAGVTARMCVYNNLGDSLGCIQPQNDPIIAPSMESNLNRTINFSLPLNWVKPGYAYHVDLDPDYLVHESNRANNRFPSQATQPFNFTFSPALNMMIVPVKYQPFSTATPFLPEIGDLAYLTWMPIKVLPIPVANYQTHMIYSYFPSTSDYNLDNLTGAGWLQLLLELTAIHNLEDPAGNLNYYGLVNSYDAHRCDNGCITGVSNISATGGFLTAVGWSGYGAGTVEASRVMVHELGHNFGRPHVNCNGREPKPDINYPYQGGSIGQWGLDVVVGNLYDPIVYRDIMSYCQDAWISDYTYWNINAYRTSRENQSAKVLPAERNLYISGYLAANGQVHLEPVYEQVSPLPALQTKGRYWVEMLDAQGKVLAAYPFQVNEVADVSGYSSFGFFVPALEDLQGVRIVDGDRVLYEKIVPGQIADFPDDFQGISAQVSAKTLRLRWADMERSHEEITYRLRLSQDLGNTWQVLALKLREPTFTMSVTPGMDLNRAIFEVQASDGIHTSTITVSTFGE